MKSERILFILIGWTVLVFFFIFKHGEIGIVATLGYVVTFHCLAHSAVGLVGVGAVVETTVGRDAENLLEVMADLLLLHVEGTKAFDAWSIDDVSLIASLIHFGKGGGVLAGFVGIADFAGAQVEMREKGVDEGRFAHTAVAREECDSPLQFCTKGFHALTCSG